MHLSYRLSTHNLLRFVPVTLVIPVTIQASYGNTQISQSSTSIPSHLLIHQAVLCPLDHSSILTQPSYTPLIDLYTFIQHTPRLYVELCETDSYIQSPVFPKPLRPSIHPLPQYHAVCVPRKGTREEITRENRARENNKRENRTTEKKKETDKMAGKNQDQVRTTLQQPQPQPLTLMSRTRRMLLEMRAPPLLQVPVPIPSLLPLLRLLLLRMLPLEQPPQHRRRLAVAIIAHSVSSTHDPE